MYSLRINEMQRKFSFLRALYRLQCKAARLQTLSEEEPESNLIGIHTLGRWLCGSWQWPGEMQPEGETNEEAPAMIQEINDKGWIKAVAVQMERERPNVKAF